MLRVEMEASQLEANSAMDRPIRVYADGIYDLFHLGHAHGLEQAKTLFPNTYLLVGCCNDEMTHKYKGKTVMTDKERYESLRHCKWVDEVIPDAPWVITQDFLDLHRIDYVAHDSLPYADATGAGNDVYEYVKSIGKFKETKRMKGLSTSNIITRIIKDYNDYVMRNLDRGYTRDELGLSYVKEKRLRVKRELHKLRENFGDKIQAFGKSAGKRRNRWGGSAGRSVAGFLGMFGQCCHGMVTCQIPKRIRSKSSNGIMNDGDAGHYKHSDSFYYTEDEDEEDEDKE